MENNIKRVNMNESTVNLLQKDTIPMQILNILMDWIMDGQLKMGEKLNTEELARKLGVSRMPIREALNSLEKMGLAESVPYVGTRLVTLTKEDIIQIYLMRKMLEPLVVVKACEKITQKDIEKLEEIHKEYVSVVMGKELDAKSVYLLNRRFHFTIYSISGMDRICNVIESLWDTLSFFKLIYGRDILKSNDGVQNRIQEHQSYIDVLKLGDSQQIGTLLTMSLENRIEAITMKTDFYDVKEIE